MPVKVKICGVRTREIVDTAVDAGADYIGLVFFPKSPRHLELEAAQPLAQAALGRIGPLRSRSIQTTRLSTASSPRFSPNLLQLHGSETPDRVASIRARFGLPIIKAIGVASADDVAKGCGLSRHCRSDPVRCQGAEGSDSPADKAGVSIGALDGLSAERPFALSGGLDPDNVWEALP